MREHGEKIVELLDTERDSLSDVLKLTVLTEIYAMNLFPRENFAVLFVMLADANQVVALEIADGHMAETATELHKLEYQNPSRSPLICVYRVFVGGG